ncbi:MAG: (2Fe-2S)-binding protein [Rhodoferax sp.]|jgi:[NiFe] hydrogenase diaphorase moiety small subunit|nr:(2Fe-2S)-binding protein [Rhodoferax sp.]
MSQNDRIDALSPGTFILDGEEIDFGLGESILEAATRTGHYIPHLCWHPEFGAKGSCRLCTVRINGRIGAACAVQAASGQEVESNTDDLNGLRKTLLQMIFIEGNHFCPSCEKSGNCKLQANAYDMGMDGPYFEEFYPERRVDATHPDLLLDLNRCILCSLCVRASHDVDGKDVFAIGGHGIQTHLLINSPSGKMVDSELKATDRAANVCPVGAILHKRVGFATPIGKRKFDAVALSEQVEETRI